MSVTNSQKVSSCAISCTCTDIVIQDSLQIFLVLGVCLEVLSNIIVEILLDISDCVWISHKLQQSIIHCEGNQVVNREAQIQTMVSENLVHYCKELNHQLVLSHVITSFKHHRKGAWSILYISFHSIAEREHERSCSRCKDLCLFNYYSL